jgi:hypothetical protein
MSYHLVSKYFRITYFQRYYTCILTSKHSFLIQITLKMDDCSRNENITRQFLSLSMINEIIGPCSKLKFTLADE